MIVRGARGWSLRLLGEPESPLDLADHDPDRRAALMGADGLERVLVAPSTPLGIEALPAGEAEPLLAAYHEGVAALPEPFGAWAAVGLDAPDPATLSGLLDQGFAGACVAAEALDGPAGYERLGPVLETLERRDAPLLVHPGPVPAAAPAGAPRWWAALTHYVAAMQVAWFAFAVWGRPAHPGLRVCFAMLAGLAPLQRERLLARGGQVTPRRRRVPRRLLLRRARRRRGAARDRRRPARVRLRPPRRRGPRPPVRRRRARPRCASATRRGCWAESLRRRRHERRGAAGRDAPRPRPQRAARARHPHRRRPGGVAGARAPRHAGAPLRAAVARRPRRRLGDHVDERQRHGLPRPRRLARRGRGRGG